jgi:general secretion pathway protein F
MSTTFAYRAADARGRSRRGRIAAADATSASSELQRLGLVVIEVRPTRRSALTGGAAGLRSSGSRRAVLEVTRAMAALLPAGLPVTRALTAARQAVSGTVVDALDDVRGRIDRGTTLAAALREHPVFFTPYYSGVIDAGERSGDLAGAFERLAHHLEREDELRSRILSLSIYPALLLVVGVAATAVLVLFVLPRFVELLDGAGAELPRATALLIASAARARDLWPILLGAAVSAPALIVGARSSATGRRALARVTFALPLIGALRSDAVAASFARLVGGLLSGGAPLLAALGDAHRCIDDPLARDETARIRTRVRAGASLRQALDEGGLFPPLLAQLVAVGEESGRLPAFLLQAATILERRTERAVERVVAIAEPAMIVAFGGMVGVVALALLQAVYGINAGTFR